MLTRLITSQHDHGGYFCMGINNSLNFQESWYLPPPLVLVSLGRLSRGWPARLYSSLPFFFPLPPSLSPHFPIPLTDGLLTEKKSHAQLSQQQSSCQNLAGRRQASKLNPKRRGVWAPARLYVLTEQHLHEVNHNGGSVSGGGAPGKANGVGGSRKRQRQRHTSH